MRRNSRLNLDLRAANWDGIHLRLSDVFDDTKLILNLTRGTIVCERVWEDSGPLSRMRGLHARPRLTPGEGVLLTPATSIHTAGMRARVDVVFLDRTLSVIRVVAGLRPWRIAGAPGARCALETAAGEASRSGVAAGDRLALLDRHGAFDRPDPIPVLLISNDWRFRAVAGELLRSRGFAVTSQAQTRDIPRAAKRLGAEVVVLDTAAALDSVGGETVNIEELSDEIGLVAVCEDPPPFLPGVRALVKWGPIDALHRAIEHASLAHRRFSGRSDGL